MAVLDAARTWVVPTLAAVVSVVVFIVHNMGIIAEPPTVTTIGGLGFALLLFYGLRGFSEQTVRAGLAALLGVFALLWIAAVFLPFYHVLNPGTPQFQGNLAKTAALTVPLHDRPGRYQVAVEGHFVAAQGHVNRSGTYHITLGQGGTAQRVLEGTFTQDWRQQRVGAGRRSTAVPVLHEVTLVRNYFDVENGADLSLTLNDLSADLIEPLSIRVYAEVIPQWAWTVLGVLALTMALVVDAFRRPNEQEGLMSALTVATLVAVVVFYRSTSRVPGLPQLVVSALAGVVAGAAAGPLFSRLLDPVRRLLPTQPS